MVRLSPVQSIDPWMQSGGGEVPEVYCGDHEVKPNKILKKKQW